MRAKRLWVAALSAACGLLPPLGGAPRLGFADVEAALGNPLHTETRSCGGGADKYGREQPLWRCVVWSYDASRFAFDQESGALVRCEHADGTRVVRRDPEALRLALLASGDPGLVELAREAPRDVAPYDETVPAWSRADCDSLLPAKRGAGVSR